MVQKVNLQGIILKESDKYKTIAQHIGYLPLCGEERLFSTSQAPLTKKSSETHIRKSYDAYVMEKANRKLKNSECDFGILSFNYAKESGIFTYDLVLYKNTDKRLKSHY